MASFLKHLHPFLCFNKMDLLHLVDVTELQEECEGVFRRVVQLLLVKFTRLKGQIRKEGRDEQNNR